MCVCVYVGSTGVGHTFALKWGVVVRLDDTRNDTRNDDDDDELFVCLFAGKLVPFVELAVAHASVLTIMAISLERYYVITRPLRAGYTCTRMRALAIILAIWILGSLTSRYDATLIH